MNALQIISVTALVLLSAAVVGGPTYCGWRILDRRPEKKRIASTPADHVLGLATMLLGIYGFMWFPYAIGAYLHNWILGNACYGWPSTTLILLVTAGPAAVSAGVIGSGARVCAVVRWMPRICRSWKDFSDGEAWQRFFGGCSLLTGVAGVCLAFIVFAGLVDHLPFR